MATVTSIPNTRFRSITQSTHKVNVEPPLLSGQQRRYALGAFVNRFSDRKPCTAQKIAGWTANPQLKTFLTENLSRLPYLRKYDVERLENLLAKKDPAGLVTGYLNRVAARGVVHEQIMPHINLPENSSDLLFIPGNYAQIENPTLGIREAAAFLVGKLNRHDAVLHVYIVGQVRSKGSGSAGASDVLADRNRLPKVILLKTPAGFVPVAVKLQTPDQSSHPELRACMVCNPVEAGQIWLKELRPEVVSLGYQAISHQEVSRFVAGSKA